MLIQVSRASLALILVLLAQTTIAETFELTDPALHKCINAIAKKKGWQTQAEVNEIKCHNKGIGSLEGLEQFPNLETLSLYKNKIVAVNLETFTRLKHLNLAGNQLSSLAILEQPRLEVLYIFHNQLESLSVVGSPDLRQIKANNNRLIQTELRGLPQLEKLYLFDNQLEIIDIAEAGALRYLDVRQNPMPDDFYDYLDSLPGLTSLHDGNADDWN